MTVESVGEIALRSYPLWRRGKVRDVFDLGDRFLFVASDRISAFDVILPNLIPGKGELLTRVSRFWFERTRHIVPNHVITFDVDDLDVDENERRILNGRSMVVRKAERIDVECVVRARLAGSGWGEYRQHGTLAGAPLPAGLHAGDPLPELRFTPATKNDAGHDENISIATLRETVGRNLGELLEVTSKALFLHAQRVSAKAGLAIADTKFEFGFIDGELSLIDEALTPDSSRYWNLADLAPDTSPMGFDKQVIRDWLLASGWDREPPAPVLPDAIIDLARARYAEVLHRLEATTAAQAQGGYA